MNPESNESLSRRVAEADDQLYFCQRCGDNFPVEQFWNGLCDACNYEQEQEWQEIRRHEMGSDY